MQNNQLSKIFTEARTAAPYVVRDRGPGMEPQYLPKRSAVLRSLNLKTSFLPSLFDKNGRLISAPIGTPAGETIALDAAVIKSSRVARAGAHVLIREDQLRPIPTGPTGGIALADVPATFSTIEPAVFTNVADDAEVAVTATLPMHRTTMDWSTAQAVAVRFEVPRSSQKEHEDALFADELLIALALGLGRAADRLLLAAIASTTPPAFTLGAAAAQGLMASELRAVVGTNGDGTYFGADGSLIVNPFDTNGWKPSGIPAELSADMAGTLVGAWNRAAIAISGDVQLLAERTTKNGTLAITAWAHMIPMLPDSSKFWTVTA